MCRLLSLYTLLFLLSVKAAAQYTFYKVTAGSGIQTVAGVNVTITPKDSARLTNSYYYYNNHCDYSNYYELGYGFGDTITHAGGEYFYKFSPALKQVSFKIFGMDSSEVISLFMNGTKFHLRDTNIKPITNCNVTSTALDTSYFPQYTVQGNLVAHSDAAIGTITLTNPGGVIDSMSIKHLNGKLHGVGYELYIATPDTMFNISQPFTDTSLCPGDTLRIKYDVTVKFPANNVFTAYISDNTGSFTNGTVIGTKSSDTSGVIKWAVPGTIIPGAGYRVKMTSSNPVRHPADNLINIKIGAIPEMPVLTVNTPLCTNSPINLNANSPTPNTTYTWWGPNFYSTQQSPTIPFAALNNSGMYYVRSNLFYCSRFDSINIVVNQSPANTFTATSNSPICEGDTLYLASSNTYPGTVYSWVGPLGFTGAKQKDTVTLTSIHKSGKYAVKATLGNCFVTDTAVVTVKQLPFPIVPVSNSPVCAGDSLKFSNFNPLPGTVLTWTGPDNFYFTGQKPFIDTTKTKTSGKYYITASLAGCIIKDSINAVVKLKPGKPLAFSNSPICFEDSLHLHATDTTANLTYTWKGPSGFKSGKQDTVIYGTGFNYRGNYTVTASLNGCEQTSDSTIVIVHSIPTPIAKEVTPVCEGESILLKATDTTTGVSLKWYSPSGSMLSAQDSVIIQHTLVSHTGKYYVTSTIDNCVGSDTTDVFIKPMPRVPTLSNNGPICSGTDLLLNAIDTGVTYQWTGPDNFSATVQNPVIDSASILASGIYKLVVDLNGCETSNTMNAIVKPTPLMKLRANTPLSIGDDLSITVINGISGTSFNWTGPDKFTYYGQNVIISRINTTNGGMYRVTSLLDGCTAHDSILITINEVADTGKFLLYPNPNAGKFILTGLMRADQKVNYEVLDDRGRTVLRDVVSTVDKLLYIDFDMPYLRQGVYLLRFRADGSVVTFRFVVLR